MRNILFKVLCMSLCIICLVGCSSGRRDNFDTLKEDLNKKPVTTTPKATPTERPKMATPTPYPSTLSDTEIEQYIVDNTSCAIVTSVHGSYQILTIVCKYPTPRSDKEKEAISNTDVDIVYIKTNAQTGEIVSEMPALDNFKLNKFNEGLYEYSLLRVIFPKDFVFDNFRARVTTKAHSYVPGTSKLIDSTLERKAIGSMGIDLTQYGIFYSNSVYCLYSVIAEKEVDDNYIEDTFYVIHLNSRYLDSSENIFNNKIPYIGIENDKMIFEGKVTKDPNNNFGAYFVTVQYPKSVESKVKDEYNSHIFIKNTETGEIEEVRKTKVEKKK